MQISLLSFFASTQEQQLKESLSYNTIQEIFFTISFLRWKNGKLSDLSALDLFRNGVYLLLAVLLLWNAIYIYDLHKLSSDLPTLEAIKVLSMCIAIISQIICFPFAVFYGAQRIRSSDDQALSVSAAKICLTFQLIFLLLFFIGFTAECMLPIVEWYNILGDPSLQVTGSATIGICLYSTLIDTVSCKSFLVSISQKVESESLTIREVDELRDQFDIRLKRGKDLITIVTIMSLLNAAAFVFAITWNVKSNKLDEKNTEVFIIREIFLGFLGASVYLKEPVYLFLSLYYIADVNEQFKKVMYQIATTRCRDDDQKLLHVSLYLELSERPVTYNILGTQPTYKSVITQLSGFVIATLISVTRASIVQRSSVR